MKIYKFNDYILNESAIGNTPEETIKLLLTKFKRRIEKMFSEEDEQVDTFDESTNKERVKDGGMSFKDLDIRLESSEISQYSYKNQNLKVIFSDGENRYDLIITVDLKDAITEEEDKIINVGDIEKCSVEFKKYTNDELIGNITKYIDVKEIDEELLMDLKIELDEAFDEGDDNEELEIEMED